MDYLELFDQMKSLGMIQDSWQYVLSLVNEELVSSGVSDKDTFMILFVCYFSLIDDGNVFMSLDEKILSAKIQAKIDMLKTQYQEEEKAKDDSFDKILACIQNAYPALQKITTLSIVNESSIFCIEDNKLYTRKYFNAVKGIRNSAGRIFTQNIKANNPFDYHTVVTGGFNLSGDQEEVVAKGYYNNLYVTGGPGTGKTTSIFFLLFSLLMDNPDYQVYLAAPSGKAAARMKDSILSSVNYINSSTPEIAETVEKIKSLEEHTIHRLLQFDFNSNGFKNNKYNRFEDNSFFVIDEGSMIDVCLFDALLSAIPDNSRVFLLGDKDQLPSVECGSVFGSLIAESNPENKVVLTESKRFSKTSEIFALAEAINTPSSLPTKNEDWVPWENFSIEKTAVGRDTPIYYYSDDCRNQAEMIEKIVGCWFDEFYKPLQAQSVDLDPTDVETLKSLYEKSENARILCASNDSVRGRNQINKGIIKKYFNQKDKTSGFYAGEILIINTNDYSLDLYNGDCGIAVTFKDDDFLYIMFKKSTNLKLDEGKVDGRIFKIDDFIFYPADKIGRDIIDSAFAITIHKSQGSDYNNILVILPKMKGHSLLNRQIVYTAITRTKGSTYILSNQENLESARDTVLIRDTF